MENKTLWLVDDDEIFTLIGERLFKKNHNWRAVKVFTSAEEVLAELKSNHIPDVLITDLNMPVTSGWDLLNELSKRSTDIQKNTCVLVLSSSIDPTDQQRAFDYPFVKGFYSKPLTLNLIDSIIKTNVVAA